VGPLKTASGSGSGFDGVGSVGFSSRLLGRWSWWLVALVVSGLLLLLDIVVGASDGTAEGTLAILFLLDLDLDLDLEARAGRLDLVTLVSLTPNRSMRHRFTQFSNRKSAWTPEVVLLVWSG